MRNLIKKYITIETRNKLRSQQPAFMFQKKSYSQCGEDLIVSFALNLIHGSKPKSYLDIGANHPFHISNSALLYSEGGKGTLIEPDPYFAEMLRKKRPRDKIYQCGVHFSGDDKADLFIFDTPTLNTFSKQEAERYVSLGHKLTQTLMVDLLNINTILESTDNLDFMSIDIEGLDLTILKMIDWNKYRPTCICVETISYETINEPEKNHELISFMGSKNYFLYADTFINSIFIDRNKWCQHWSKK